MCADFLAFVYLSFYSLKVQCKWCVAVHGRFSLSLALCLFLTECFIPAHICMWFLYCILHIYGSENDTKYSEWRKRKIHKTVRHLLHCLSLHALCDQSSETNIWKITDGKCTQLYVGYWNIYVWIHFQCRYTSTTSAHAVTETLCINQLLIELMHRWNDESRFVTV